MIDFMIEIGKFYLFHMICDESSEDVGRFLRFSKSLNFREIWTKEIPSNHPELTGCHKGPQEKPGREYIGSNTIVFINPSDSKSRLLQKRKCSGILYRIIVQIT